MKEVQLTDNIKVINADCMQIMQDYPDKYFDLAIVDPPYGMPKQSALGAGKMRKRVFSDMVETGWDTKPDHSYFTVLLSKSKNQIVWGGQYFTDMLPVKREWCYWDKKQPWDNFSKGELAWTSFEGTVKQFEYDNRTAKIHPTQKPIALYDWLLKNYSNPEHKILDTHLGSGSHMIAAHYFGVKEFVGIELDKDYFEASIKRFREYISKHPKQGQKVITGNQTNIFQEL